MNDTVRQFRDFFVSLKLTVVLLVLSMILIFAATLDQVHLGIWAVQEKYFRSLFVLWHVREIPIPVFPGGYLIGGFLLLNLIGAHFYRFKFSLRKSGIWLTHVGLILLLIGELLTGLWQEDYQMSLTEGETKNYAESFRNNELVFIETTDPKVDDVVAVPEPVLAREKEIQHPKLPFRVLIRSYFPNGVLGLRSENAQIPAAASQGVGPKLVVSPAPLTFRQDERNAPAAVLELMGPDGSLGTWVVSTHLAAAQTVKLGDRTWRLGLRFERDYQPFSLTLLKVTHDVYIGTDIPKNFSSRVRISTPGEADNREVLIYMNNPLRHGGLTFYQYQMNSEQGMSVFQVVRNPSWLIPYISCTIIVLGLLLQFGIHLAAFFTRRRQMVAA